MDIKQHPSARAAVLLGKGMSLRDHAQGCWRMRGLDIGQTLQLLVVPEVAKMIKDASGNSNGCWTSDGASTIKGAAKTKRVREMLHDVMTWLMINGHENEKLQKSQLDMQGARSSVRTPAFEFLLSKRASMPDCQPTRIDWGKAKLFGDAPFVDADATPREVLDELEKPCYVSRFGPDRLSVDPVALIQGELLDTNGILADLASRLRLSKSALKEEAPKYELRTEAEAALRMVEALRELPREVRLTNWQSDYNRHSIALVPFVERWGVGSRMESLNRDELPQEMMFVDEREKRQLRALHDRVRNAESQRLTRVVRPKGVTDNLNLFLPREERHRQREARESSDARERDARRLKAFGTAPGDQLADVASRTSESPTSPAPENRGAGTAPLADEKPAPVVDMKQYSAALAELQQAAKRPKVLASATVETIQQSQDVTQQAIEDAKRAGIANEVPELGQLQIRLDDEKKACLRAKRRQAGEDQFAREADRYKIGKPLDDDGQFSLLTGCVRVFQESLATTLNITAELGGGKRHEQALEEELDRFKAIIASFPTAKSLEDEERNEINKMKAQRASAPSARSGKGEDEASGLDSEMVQEQEAELEKEQHDFGPFDTTLTDGETPWKLTSLLDPLKPDDDPTFSLDRLRPHGAAQVINYPQGALRFSPNFASPDYDKLTRRRLRTANAILVIPREASRVVVPREGNDNGNGNSDGNGNGEPVGKRPSVDAAATTPGPQLQYILMTLAETEAVLIRRDLIASVPGCDIVTLDGSSMLRHRDNDDANVHDNSDATLHWEMIQLLRFWSSHAFYTHNQIERLLEGLERIEELQALSSNDGENLAYRKAAFIASAECRRRDRFDTTNTPVEVAFTLTSAREYRDLVTFVGELRAAIGKHEPLLKGENGFKQIFEATSRPPAVDAPVNDEAPQIETIAGTKQLRVLNELVIRRICTKLGLESKLADRVAKRLHGYEFGNFARDLAVPIANAMMIEAQSGSDGTSGFSGLRPRVTRLLDDASRLAKPCALALLIASESSAEPPTGETAMSGRGSQDWRSKRDLNVIVPKHLVPQEVASIGHLFLASGARVNVFANNLIRTDAGRRPTLVPRGVRLTEGLWYYEVEVIQPSSAGFAAIGWVNSRWGAGIEGTDTGRKGPLSVGTDAHSWGLTAALHKKHDGVEEPLSRSGASLCAGDVVGCVADIAACTVSFSLNGSIQRLGGVAYRGTVAIAHGLTPAVTIEFGFQCRINFGERPFRHPPMPSAGVSGLRVPQPVLAHVTELRLRALNIEDSMDNEHDQRGNAVDTPRLRPTTGLCFLDTERLAEYRVVSKYNYGCASVVLRGLLLTTGKWYFEVKGSDWGGFRVGFATEEFTGRRQTHTIGDDKQSWSLGWQSRGRERGSLMHNGRTKRVTAANLHDRWIGVALDLTARTIDFVLPLDEPAYVAYYNKQQYHLAGGVKLHAGFEGVIPGTGLVPAIGVKWRCAVDVNFGDNGDFRLLDQVPTLSDYRPVSEAIAESRARRSSPELMASMPTPLPASRSLRDGIRLVALSGAEHVILESDRCVRYVGGEGFLASVKAAGVKLGIGKWALCGGGLSFPG